jgi:hypothetical protein
MNTTNTQPTAAEIQEAIGRLTIQREVMSVFDSDWADAMTEAIGLIRFLLAQVDPT